jgi:hypothetical protein
MSSPNFAWYRMTVTTGTRATRGGCLEILGEAFLRNLKYLILIPP